PPSAPPKTVPSGPATRFQPARYIADRPAATGTLLRLRSSGMAAACQVPLPAGLPATDSVTWAPGVPQPAWSSAGGTNTTYAAWPPVLKVVPWPQTVWPTRATTAVPSGTAPLAAPTLP